jgi:hypothetical protein
MRVNGEWLECDDGVVRPGMPGSVRIADGQMLEGTFLVDGGADRTVFSVDLLALLQPLATDETEQIHLAGVGGEVGSITVQTVVGFLRDDGQLITVRGAFGVFTVSESSEMSVLGRDVTNNFDVIYSFPRREVTLLAPPHSYQIQHPS